MNYVKLHGLTTSESLKALSDALETRETEADLLAVRSQVETLARGAKVGRDSRTMTVCTELKKQINAKLRKARRK